jgi:hypothetical protein
MATAVARFYQRGLDDILWDVISLSTDTLKLVPVNTTYVFDPDHTLFDNSANDSTDPSFCEIVATNYTGGHGGAGRKTATISHQVDNSANRVVLTIADVTWSAIGGATNDTLGAVLLIKENAADTSARLIAYIEFKDGSSNKITYPTNSGDITTAFASLGSGGEFRFPV